MKKAIMAYVSNPITKIITLILTCVWFSYNWNTYWVFEDGITSKNISKILVVAILGFANLQIIYQLFFKKKKSSFEA